jgi:hypothetical protein
MRMTLLDLVQEILSSMDSDEVNSISDTIESMQVAMVVRRAFLDISSRLNLPESFDFFKLVASTSNDLPTVMYRPEEIDQLLWVKYDKRLDPEEAPKFLDIAYLNPTSFFDRMFMMNGQQPNIGSSDFAIDGNPFKLFYFNDRHPNYWTSVDDRTLVFDAYYSPLDSTLQHSKTYCYGLTNCQFELKDSYTPPLDSQQFSLLLNDAKALAWAELKQASHQRAEREAKRQLVTAQKNKRSLPSRNYADLNNAVNYGRK